MYMRALVLSAAVATFIGCGSEPKQNPPLTQGQIDDAIRRLRLSVPKPAPEAAPAPPVPARRVIVREWRDQWSRREWSTGEQEIQVPSENAVEWARLGYKSGEWVPAREFEADNRRGVAAAFREMERIKQRTTEIILAPDPCPAYRRGCY